MTLLSTTCPACKSGDTVGCWDKPAVSRGDAFMRPVLEYHYPDARECVDCGYVWWKDPKAFPVLSKIGRAR